MKLELKHLSPYLPYNLNMILKKDEWMEWKVQEIKPLRVLWFNDNQESIGYKPILRPLSDLTKYKNIIFKLQKFNNDTTLLFIDFDYKVISYWEYEFLIENHFDVFGLIEKGLAIDINTLKN